MPKIGRIGHAVLYVSDLEASSRWYRDVLGMVPVIRGETFPMAFFSFGKSDHDIALLQVSDGRNTH